IMAFWNAPLDDDDHAGHACSLALAMMDVTAKLNVTLEAEAAAENKRFIPINVGIGLNSGECCVGNIGSEQRFDYSVLGDDVNLVSRLEGQSKTYGVDIVLGENTRERAPDYAYIELDLIKVNGKNDAVRVFALMGKPARRDDSDF
ncbi:MAG: adenylate/guanylate cyclase domain-containing protein, partial [Pseudomonadota bacterium]|nr:adenylate/guanylate cyclase domain-containing protein [Pseudomonadota bacterium]